MSGEQDRFWQEQQRRNNDAFRREADERMHAQRAQHERRMQEQGDRHWDQRRRGERAQDGPSVSSGGTHPVVWFFGLFGALFGGVLSPWGIHGAFGAFFGFVVAGMSAGFLSQFRVGRIVLLVVGLGLLALVATAILRP